MDKLQAVARCRELITGLDVAMISMVADDGKLHSRPMAFHDIDDDGQAWFFFKRDPGAPFAIGHNEHASVCLFDRERDRYVSLGGTAMLLDDSTREHELWTPQMRTYFPDGVDAPDLVLVKLAVENVEFWDSPRSPITAAISFVKAAVSGSAGWGGRHEHFDMPH